MGQQAICRAAGQDGAEWNNTKGVSRKKSNVALQWAALEERGKARGTL